MIRITMIKGTIVTNKNNTNRNVISDDSISNMNGEIGALGL